MLARHVNVDFPGHKHATLYDVNKIEYEVNKYLKSIGVSINLMPRIVDVVKKGVVVLKIPKEDVNLDKLKSKVCQRYVLKEFAENIVLLDTGHAKLMTTYYPLEKLRKIKGLEKVKFIDLYAEGKGNSIRYLAVTPRDNSMKVQGISNLFVTGEKSGLFVGHTEAICTGTLAGYNSLRYASKLQPFILPE